MSVFGSVFYKRQFLPLIKLFRTSLSWRIYCDIIEMTKSQSLIDLVWYILDIYLYFWGQGHCLLLLFVNLVCLNVLYKKTRNTCSDCLKPSVHPTHTEKCYINVFSLCSQHGHFKCPTQPSFTYKEAGRSTNYPPDSPHLITPKLLFTSRIW